MADEKTASTVVTDRQSALIERLYRDYWADVLGFVRSRFGPGSPEPEEVAQTAFERLLGWGAPDALSDPRSFLFAVAANIVRDHLRRTSVRKAAHQALELQHRDFSLSGPTPESVLEARQRLDALKACLARMPVVRRRVFLLIRIECMSVAEVAARFGMSEAAVYKHVSRALHDCMKAVEERTAGRKR